MAKNLMSSLDILDRLMGEFLFSLSEGRVFRMLIAPLVYSIAMVNWFTIPKQALNRSDRQ